MERLKMFGQTCNPIKTAVSYVKNLDWSEDAVNRRLEYTFYGLALVGTLALAGIASEVSKQHPGFFYSGQTTSKAVSADEARVAPKNDLELNVVDEQ